MPQFNNSKHSANIGLLILTRQTSVITGQTLPLADFASVDLIQHGSYTVLVGGWEAEIPF